jgi:hypothetical protein
MGEAIGIIILVLLFSPVIVMFLAAFMAFVLGPIYAFVIHALSREK